MGTNAGSWSSPLPSICMLTRPLDPGRPRMPGSMRAGPIPWPIRAPPPPPMWPWGPQPCCMEPRMGPLLSMSARRRQEPSDVRQEPPTVTSSSPQTCVGHGGVAGQACVGSHHALLLQL